MYRIIGPRRSGKTTELIHLAAEEDAIIVCGNVNYIKMMARDLGCDNLKVISYSQFFQSEKYPNSKFVIDELEGLLIYFHGPVLGYSLSAEGFVEQTNEEKQEWLSQIK